MRASVLRCVCLAASVCACKPELVVGERGCFADRAATASEGGNGGANDEPLLVPWATGFEKGFCDYRDSGGYCKVNTGARHEIVRSPVHRGDFAAAYSVTADGSEDALQARCAMGGSLPPSATYGAWYYFPSYAQTSSNGTWNLFHFEGWNGAAQHHLWDVSVETYKPGVLRLYVFDFLNGGKARPPEVTVPITFGAWIHIEFSIARAADATGEIALFQDGQELLRVSGIVTDDSERAEWYVGNFADVLTPADSTLYVDDVSIEPPR